MEITEIRIMLRDEEKLKGFANVTFDNAFVVRGLKIISGNSGFFVSMPSRKRPDGTHQDVCHPIKNETRRMIEEAVLKAYEDETGAAGVAVPVGQTDDVLYEQQNRDGRESIFYGAESAGTEIRTPDDDRIYESSMVFKIDSDDVSPQTVSELIERLTEALKNYGAVATNIKEFQGSKVLKLIAKFRNFSDKAKFEKDILTVAKELKRLIKDGYHSLDEKYIQKAILENEKLRDSIRTEEERNLENKLLVERILETRLKNMKLLAEIIRDARQYGDLEISNELTGELVKIIGEFAYAVENPKLPQNSDGEIRAGAMPGAGTFICTICETSVTLKDESDVLPQCPNCAHTEFAQA